MRELRNVVERSLYCWPTARHADEPVAPWDFLLRIVSCEQKLLAGTLVANRFNQGRTAALGLSYDQLRHYRKKRALAVRR